MPRPRKLPAVAAQGDRLSTLEAMRNYLANEIQECESSRDTAALGRLLVDVLAQIDAIGGSGGQSAEDKTFDELAKRRGDRGADPTSGHSSGSPHSS